MNSKRYDKRLEEQQNNMTNIFLHQKKMEKFYTEIRNIVLFVCFFLGQVLFNEKHMLHHYSHRDVMSKRSIELGGIQFDL